MSNFVPFSRDQAFLLPPDLRSWIPADDVVHFVVAAVERVPLNSFGIPERTGAPAPNNEGQTTYPQCVWYGQISSSSTGSYTGKVTPEPQGNAFFNNRAGYTPTCTASNLSVNSTSGAWSVSLNWVE